MAEKIAGIQPLQECLLKTLGENLIGIYLHGSLAFGCFHPLKSDIDVLAVVERPLTQPEKEKVIHSLLSIWHFAPEKGYEMSIVLEKVCRRFAYPTPYELHFSKAWIERFREDSKSVCNDFPKTDPDLAAHFAVVKARGITLFARRRRSYLRKFQKRLIWIVSIPILLTAVKPLWKSLYTQF